MGAEIGYVPPAAKAAADGSSLDAPMPMSPSLGGEIHGSHESVSLNSGLGMPQRSEMEELVSIGCRAIALVEALRIESSLKTERAFEKLREDQRLKSAISQAFDSLSNLGGDSSDPTQVNLALIKVTELVAPLRAYARDFEGMSSLVTIFTHMSEGQLSLSQVDLPKLHDLLEVARGAMVKYLGRDNDTAPSNWYQNTGDFRAWTSEQLKSLQAKLIERGARPQVTPLQREKLAHAETALAYATKPQHENEQAYLRSLENLLKVSVDLRGTSFISAALEKVIQLTVQAFASGRLGTAVECLRRESPGLFGRMAERITGRERATWVSVLGNDKELAGTIKGLRRDFSIRVRTPDALQRVITHREKRDAAERNLAAEVIRAMSTIDGCIAHGSKRNVSAEIDRPNFLDIPLKEGRLIGGLLGGDIGAFIVAGMLASGWTGLFAMWGPAWGYIYVGIALAAWLVWGRLIAIEYWNDGVGRSRIDHTKPTDSEALETLIDFCRERRVFLRTSARKLYVKYSRDSARER